MEQALRFRVQGPLAGCLAGFVEWLAAQGFAPSTLLTHAGHLSLLSRWLDRDDIEPWVVDEALITHLVEVHHRGGHDRSVKPASFRLLVGYLRSIGVVAPARPSRETARVEALLEDYRRYLSVERGLRPATVDHYVWQARHFLDATCAGDPGRVRALTARDVARFVTAAAVTHRPASVNTVVVNVRALLRWLYAAGLIDTPLAQATPWLARGAASTLPRTIPTGAAVALLEGFDRSTLVGARDFAIVTLFARLALRVGEVAEMQVGDIDWRRGELDVRSKGGWRDSLPLTADVGEALADYLTRRGRDRDMPQVFWCMRAPHRPITATAIKAVVRHGCERVGLPAMATHWLRHSLARDLLAQGASLPEIGQVLRHHNLATTAIYAKVDLGSLASVTQPWPGSAQ